MNDILEEIKAERLLEDKEWAGTARAAIYEPEKWCSLLRHQTRLADRAACSLATDEITGREKQSLITGYRERLITIAVVALAAAESLDRVLKSRRSVVRAKRRQKK